MIIAWFMARLVPIGAGLTVLVALVAWDRVRIWKAETRGAEKVVAKIEKATDERISKADSAGTKSRSGGGVLNPNYRD